MKFTDKQLNEAKAYTNRVGKYDIENQYIQAEYDALTAEEKEVRTKDLWELYEAKNDLLMAVLEISAKYFCSEPVLYCLFKEHQAKLRREGKLE